MGFTFSVEEGTDSYEFFVSVIFFSLFFLFHRTSRDFFRGTFIMSFPAFLALILVGVFMVGESDSVPMNTGSNPSGSKDSESPMQASRPVECLGIDCGFAHGHKCCREPRNQSGSKVEEKWIKQAAFRLKAEAENLETPMQAGVRYATPMECCMNPKERCCHRSCRCRRSKSGSGWIQERIQVEEKSIKQAAFRLKAETENLETPKQAGKVGLGVRTKDLPVLPEIPDYIRYPIRWFCCFFDQSCCRKQIAKDKEVKAE